MRYLSLFSGVGGFELGIQRAYDMGIKSTDEITGSSKSQVQHGRIGSTVEVEQSILSGNEWSRPVCIGFSEIDPYTVKVYQHHFPNHTNYGDVTKIDAATLPDFDFLVGGFPCQAFSVAGKRHGFNDTRGTLFFDVARIVRKKQPRLVLLENVKGLLSHDKGNTFATILATLDELGYDVQWQVLNAKDFGVPQNRERVFIVGHLRGTPRPEVFPLGGTEQETNGHRSVPKVIARGGLQNHAGEMKEQSTALTEAMGKGGGQTPIIKQLNNPTHSNDRVYGTEGVSPTLNTMQGGNRQPFVKIPEATKKGYAEATEGIAQTVDTGMQQHTLTADAQIRRLTPLECERLMSWPDNWTNVEGMSDTQRYKQCGNGVVSNVVAAVVDKIVRGR